MKKGTEKRKLSFFKKGFTLTELLIIIFILGILGLGAIPAFRNFRSTLQLSNLTQEIVGDLRYIQQLTVTEQVEYCFKILPDDNKYYLKKCAGEDIKERIITEAVEFYLIDGFDDNEIKYNPYGAVKQAGTISLKNSKGEMKNILVKPSGFVSVID